jgi:multiple sugar transport system substrate-binding protein
MSATDSRRDGVNRRNLLKGGAGAALLAGLGAATPAKAAGKKVVIGGFVDGALVPFKDKIIPLAQAQGFDIQFLQDEYGVTLEKFFNDAQSGAGQYDLYLLDDPWVPQFGAAEVLEDLGAAGIDGTDKDWVKPMIDMGYWPPQTGPRVKGFEGATPKLICVPFIGDIQTFTYRNDVYTDGPPKTWDEVIEKGKAGVAGGKIKYPVVFPGLSGNPIVTSWHPLLLSFGGDFFDDKWNTIFNSEVGKASADYLVTTLKQNAPPGVVEFGSDQQGAGMLGGDCGATIQYTGNALVSDDPSQSKEVGKLDFSVVPKKEKAIAQIGIFISGIPKTAPNKANAIEFLKWFVTPEIQAKLSAAGAIPVKRGAFTVPPAGNRLIPVTLAQFDSGAMPRPRTPDWAKIEELVGIQLNKALQAGTGGGAALDVAAGQIKDYLTQAGYYK